MQLGMRERRHESHHFENRNSPTSAAGKNFFIQEGGGGLKEIRSSTEEGEGEPVIKFPFFRGRQGRKVSSLPLRYY